MSGGEQNMKKQNLLTDFFESLNDKKIAHKLYKDINKKMREPYGQDVSKYVPKAVWNNMNK